MKMIFTDHQDIVNPFGKIQLNCNALEYLGKANGLPAARIRCVVRQPDESYMVYGIKGEVKCPRQFYRSRTFDGFHYEQSERVFVTEPRKWLTEFDIVHNEKNNELIAYLYEWVINWDHALWPFRSTDGGKTWARLTEKPVYHDHDAFGIMWDPQKEQFLCHNTTYQKWNKPFNDNLGNEIRRVMHIRSSKDGIHWIPDNDVLFEGMQFAPFDELITPDADDPQEIEFYRFKAFPYGGRYIGMMLVYAMSPHIASKRFPGMHGPHCYSEWWISRDGLTWNRSFRDLFASGAAPNIIEHTPMLIDGKLLWIIDGHIYGLPEDRIVYVGSKANAAFSTQPFRMPDTPLLLNAELQFLPHCSDGGMFDQSYIMVELIDEAGRVMEGYEKEKCIIHAIPANCIRLIWGDTYGQSLKGQNVSLRLYFRDARIYSVCAADEISQERNQTFKLGV